MKAVVAACFNLEKALVGAFSVIVKTSADGSFSALVNILTLSLSYCTGGGAGGCGHVTAKVGSLCDPAPVPQPQPALPHTRVPGLQGDRQDAGVPRLNNTRHVHNTEEAMTDYTDLCRQVLEV